MSFGELNIVARAAIAAIASTAITLAMAVVATSLFGGEVAGTGLLLCILCPLVIGGPASALQFWQHDRLRAAREELIIAKSKLERSNAELARQARSDGLTGVPNRRAFLGDLKSLTRQMDGTLLFVDADNFKQINDRHGHPTGDEALRALAATLAARIRESDLLARIGGEEFAIFLTGLRGNDARTVAEAIRVSVRMIDLAAETGLPVDLSISIGGAGHSAGSDVETLWRAADRNLYQAKSAGRDRVIIQDNPVPGFDHPLPVQLAS